MADGTWLNEPEIDTCGLSSRFPKANSFWGNISANRMYTIDARGYMVIRNK